MKGQECALNIMEERIDVISTIADRNFHSTSGTKKYSGLLSKEAEALRSQVRKFVLKEEQGA